jgi:hypothetical protein
MKEPSVETKIKKILHKHGVESGFSCEYSEGYEDTKHEPRIELLIADISKLFSTQQAQMREETLNEVFSIIDDKFLAITYGRRLTPKQTNKIISELKALLDKDIKEEE